MTIDLLYLLPLSFALAVWVLALLLARRDLKRGLEHATAYGAQKAKDLHKAATERDALQAQLAGIKAIIDPPPPEAG